MLVASFLTDNCYHHLSVNQNFFWWWNQKHNSKCVCNDQDLILQLKASF
jgi:hypothetical protein